jgi:hypothetical protein
MTQPQSTRYYDDPQGQTFEQMNASLLATHGVRAIHPGLDALPEGEGRKAFVLPLHNHKGELVYAQCHCSVIVHRNLATSLLWQDWRFEWIGLYTNVPTPEFLAYRKARAAQGFHLYEQRRGGGLPHPLYLLSDQGTTEIFVGLDTDPVPAQLESGDVVYCKETRGPNDSDEVGFLAWLPAVRRVYPIHDAERGIWFRREASGC